MDTATLQAQQTFLVKQRITLMINRYEVWTADSSGSPLSQVAFVEQKRMTLKEQVTLYTDERKSAVLGAFKARKVIDLSGSYDVTDGSGGPIGLFRKDFARSLLRSTWHVEQPGQAPTTGQERSLLVASLRRFTDITFLPYHFDFVRDGAAVFSVDKKWGIRDKYVVSISDPGIDRRLVIAMAVGLDALQSR